MNFANFVPVEGTVWKRIFKQADKCLNAITIATLPDDMFFSQRMVV